MYISPFVIIITVSTILSWINYHSSILYDSAKDEKKQYKNAPWQWKFFELWNMFVNFTSAGLIGYYFMSVRWKYILSGDQLNISDFLLFIIFSMCLLRWFPHLIKNFTEGITAILNRLVTK